MDQTLNTLFWPRRADSQATTGPERKPMRAPIFIHDAVTPFAGETMLLHRLRQDALDQNDAE